MQLLKLLDDVQQGKTVSIGHGSPGSPAAAAQRNTGHGLGDGSPPFHMASTPPISPRKRIFDASSMQSPIKGQLGNHSLPKALCGPVLEDRVWKEEGKTHLPKFYFPTGSGCLPSIRQLLSARTLDFLAPFDGQVPLLDIRKLLRDTYGLPMSLAYPLVAKLAPGTSKEAVPASKLHEWLTRVDFSGLAQSKRLFSILVSGGRDYIVLEDLLPLLNGILAAHPGLAFLQDTPEFQERYAETVAHRIFYSLNSTASGRMTYRDLKRGDLLQALHELEEEDDVNRCTRYFSYEHFYVIYCRFWDLDSDHDFLLTRDDLLRYSNHSLTYRIADRLFAGAARPLSSGRAGRMGYADFIWFILSEEDKTTNAALYYWFRACDLNGDNYLTQDELMWFYEEQAGRMECLSQETVPFDDIWAQMQDMLNPKDPHAFSMLDLKRSRDLAGTLFNVLFNLTKFVAFETRDPFMVRQEREDASSGLTPWERFARQEYNRLIADEGDMIVDETMTAWDGTEFE